MTQVQTTDTTMVMFGYAAVPPSARTKMQQEAT
jgi:hypothetical protein